MPAIEITDDCFDQDWERGEAPQATRLPQREDAFYPAIALLVVGPLHELAPEHGEPQGPLRSIIRGVDSSFHHKCPQGPQRLLQCPGERPRCILPVAMLAQQMDQPCIPGLYGTSGRRRLLQGRRRRSILLGKMRGSELEAELLGREETGLEDEPNQVVRKPQDHRGAAGKF